MGAQVDREDRSSSRSRARSTAARWARSRSPGSPPSSAPFEPLVPGVRFATPETLASAVGPATAAIVLEPVLGEGGVRPLSPRDARGGAVARRRARRAARSSTRCRRGSAAPASSSPGSAAGVRPDAVTLAKGLANGLPIGALLVSDECADRVRPGRPRLDLRRQPGRLRRRLRRRRDDRRRPARPRARDRRALRGRSSSTCAAPACCSRSSSAGPPARSPTRRSSSTCSSAPPARPRCASRPPLTISEDEADLGDRPAAGDARDDAPSSSGRARSCAWSSELTSRRRPSSPRRCAAEGIDAVQATVSRDVAQLGLVKVRNGDGRLIYALPGAADLRRLEQLDLGAAQLGGRDGPDRQAARHPHAARVRRRARRRDRRGRPARRSPGTVAGDNTVFVAVRDGSSAARARRRLRPLPRARGRATVRRERRPILALAAGRRAGRDRLLRRPRHLLRARVDARARARSRTPSPPTSASTTSRTSAPSPSGRAATAPRTPCSSTAARRSRARGSPRSSAARSTSRRPGRRYFNTTPLGRAVTGHAARPGDARARRRDLGRRLDLQGQRHRALLPLRAAREPGAADLQALARRGVRRRARRPQGDERVARRARPAARQLGREGLLDRREPARRDARGEGPRAALDEHEDRRADHGRRATGTRRSRSSPRR